MANNATERHVEDPCLIKFHFLGTQVVKMKVGSLNFSLSMIRSAFAEIVHEASLL